MDICMQVGIDSGDYRELILHSREPVVSKNLRVSISSFPARSAAMSHIAYRDVSLRCSDLLPADAAFDKSTHINRLLALSLNIAAVNPRSHVIHDYWPGAAVNEDAEYV